MSDFGKALSGPLVSTLAIGGAGLSFFAAREQNENLDEFGQAAADAAVQEAGQVRRRQALERQKAIDEGRRIAAAIRVGASERGVGAGGSTALLINDTARKTAREVEIININESLGIGAVGTRLDSQIASLDSQRVDPFLAAIQGGISGATAGIELGRGFFPAEGDPNLLAGGGPLSELDSA